MANISILSRLINGAQRNVDLSTNTLIVSILKVGGGAGTDLTKTILDRLVSLQNGTDVDATYHTHDGRYFTETELGSATSSSGSDLIGDDNTYSNFTPSAATVKGALEGIDSALAASADEKVGVSATDTTPGYLDEKVSVDNGSNATNALESTIQSPGGDETFRIRLDQSKIDHGSIAGLADDDHTQYIRHDGTRAFSGDQSFGGFKATNLADPVASQDAVTLSYMQARLNGLTPKAPVRAASTANVDLGSAADPNPINGVTLDNNDRVLLKNQIAPEENGIYIAVDAEDPTTWVRSPDMDSLTPIDEVNGAWVAVREGAQAGQVFVHYGIVATIGTDPIKFAYYNPIAGLIGGDMITFTGSTFSVDLASVSGLESTNPGNVAGQLRVKLEGSNPSLKITGSNELGVKLDAAGALLSGASGVAVQVDNSSIEINSNALRIKALGVTLGMLASNSVDENKIVSTSFDAAGAILGGSGTKIKANVDNSSVEINSNALRIKSTAYDQATITGGSGAAAAVQHAPLMKRTLVAGESFAANTSFAVRWALTGETAGRVYKADKDASSSAKYAAIGIALSTGAVSAGQNIDVILMGEFTQGSSDTPFASGDVGLEVFVGTSGAIILGSALANITNEAQFCIGTVQTTTKIWVDFKQLRGIA